MIKLDRCDTVRLLITKGWQHKDIPKKEEEDIFNYSKRVFASQCGIPLEYMTDGDVVHIWVGFAEEIFSHKELREYVDLTAINKYNPVRAIISIIQNLKVIEKFELDKSDIKK